MTSGNDLIPDPVLDQATGWAVRLHESPNDKAAQAEFAVWLAQGDVHARAWAKTQNALLQMGQIPAAFAHEWPRRRAGLATGEVTLLGRSPTYAFPPVRNPRSGVRSVAVALAACLLLALAVPSLQLWLAADYVTSVAETRQVPLEDGSTIHLGADSAIVVKLQENRRQVTLLRGEAYFEVAPDRSRPFTVSADDLEVTVTGTAFDVAMTDRSLSVAVASGAVHVSRPGLKETGAVELAPGQGLLIDRATGAATDTAPSDGTVGAWRSGRLIVENALLTDVVAAIDRYRSGAVVIMDDTLREKRVTGGYDLRDPERALRVLVAPYNGTVREYTPWLLVLSGE